MTCASSRGLSIEILAQAGWDSTAIQYAVPTLGYHFWAGVRVPSNQHRPGVPQVWNFIAAGWVTRLHTWPGWGGLSAISSPSPECWEVHCRLGHVDGLYIQDSRGGFTLKERVFKLQSPSVVILFSKSPILFLKDPLPTHPNPSCIRKLDSQKI